MNRKYQSGLVAVFCAGVASAAPQPPVLAVTMSNQAARVQWHGEGGVNYELQSSSNAYFTNSSSKFLMGRGGALPVDTAFDGQSSKFWRVRASNQSTGIGVATDGAYAGKLVHYDQSGNQVLLRAFGVNYYDAFLRYLRNSNDTTFVEGFSYLQEHKIPVIRVMAAGYNPKDWLLYFTNKQEYYRRLDYFVAQAEQYGVGLIIDSFFSITTVGEIVDDAVAAGILTPGVNFVPDSPLNIDINGAPTYAEYTRDLGRPDSGSNAFISYYMREVVSRYGGSPAVWGWEFSNENNNMVDHPELKLTRVRETGNGMTLPSTSTNTSILAAWTGPDDLIRADVAVAKANFASTIRSIDTWRLIMSGDSRPRREAYHNWKFHNWKVDNRAELAQVLPVDNPAPMDTVTVHIYSQNTNAGSTEIYFPTNNPITLQWLTGQYKELFDYFIQESTKLSRPLIVGEWGTTGDGTTADEKTTFHRFMQALIDSGVQISLLWDFDSRNNQMTNTWWIQTGMVPGYPASPKLYQITNTDTNLWDLEQVNRTYGSW